MVIMYRKIIDLTLGLLLLSCCILQVLGDGYYLGIRQDTGINALVSPNQANLNVWSSVAVYDASVSTADFTANELYALAQLAHTEMNNDFVTNKIGNKRRPATMAALAIGNLVYFSSSIRSRTNYIMTLKQGDVIDQKLNQCMATLEANRQLEAGQIKKHMNNAQCGEVTCLQLQRLDQAANKPDWDTTSKRQIVAYGPSDDPAYRGDVPKACCGDPNPHTNEPLDETIWGCSALMTQEGVGMYPAIAETLVLPTAMPVSIRYVALC